MKDRVLIKRVWWATRVMQVEILLVASVVAIYALSRGADSWVVNLAWLVVAGVLMVIGIREGLVTVCATERGLVVRNALRTRTISWAHADVRCEQGLSSASSRHRLTILDGGRRVGAAAAARMHRDELEAAAANIKAEIEARQQHADRS